MTDKPDKPDKPRPAFVFVDNSTERLLVLRRPVPPADGEETPKGQPTAQEETMVGRGLNYVRVEYVEANPDMYLLGAMPIDPTKIPDGDVARQLHRCTSRQAMHEWTKTEKRTKVVDQIKARLENKPEPTSESN